MKREPATPLLARPGAGPRGALRGRSAAAAPTATDIGRAWRALAVPAAANVVAPRAAASPGRVDREAGAAAFAGARLRATAQATARRIASGVQAPSAPADVSANASTNGRTSAPTNGRTGASTNGRTGASTNGRTGASTDASADTSAISPLLPPLPRFLQVEPVGRCNLACRMCAVPQRPAEQQAGLLSVEDFERLLSQLPQLEEVHLQGLGEPMLHPAFFTLVERAARRGIRVSANTNATLITPARARACVTSGLAALSFSVDGARAETYASIRVDGSFDKVLRNIARVVRARRELRSSTPTLRLVMVLMRQNLEELPALVELAARLGVPEVLVQRLASEMNEPTLPLRYVPVRRYVADSELRGLDLAETAAVFTAARERAARLGVLLHLPKLPVGASARAARASDAAGGRSIAPSSALSAASAAVSAAASAVASAAASAAASATTAAAIAAASSATAASAASATATSPCDWPFAKGYVTATGEMLPCCMVGTPDRATLGNALSDGVAAVWRGASAQQWRAGLRGGAPGPLCAQCALFRGAF